MMREAQLRQIELIWRQVEENIDLEVPLDPRWVEVGAELLDKYSLLYALVATQDEP